MTKTVPHQAMVGCGMEARSHIASLSKIITHLKLIKRYEIMTLVTEAVKEMKWIYLIFI